MKKSIVMIVVDSNNKNTESIKFINCNDLKDWSYTEKIKYTSINNLIDTILKIAKNNNCYIPYTEEFGGRLYSIYITSLYTDSQSQKYVYHE